MRCVGERKLGDSNDTPGPNGWAMSPCGLGGLEETWYRNGCEEELDPNGDGGTVGQFITSAKKSHVGARLPSELMGGGGGGANASALDTLCACGRPAKCGEGWTDAPSALERPLGMERVLRRRLEVGGERAASGTSVGPGGGVLKTEPGSKEWTDGHARAAAGAEGTSACRAG